MFPLARESVIINTSYYGYIAKYITYFIECGNKPEHKTPKVTFCVKNLRRLDFLTTWVTMTESTISAVTVI